MKTLLFATGLVVLLSLTGCAQMFSSKTKATYETRPDGTMTITYESDKEQQGIDATLPNGVRVKVDKSGTLESIVAATQQMQLQMFQLIQTLSAGAKTGALAGS